MITSTADLLREMIQEMAEVVRQRGGDLIHGGSERVEALWMEIEHHLRACDLCEILGDEDKINLHLETINNLMEKILANLPE